MSKTTFITGKSLLEVVKEIEIDQFVLKEVSKYMLPQEILLYLEEFNMFPAEYKLEMQTILKWIEKEFESIPIDKNVLSYIIFEINMAYLKLRTERKRRIESRPFFHAGALDLLKWIESKKDKSFETTSILIYTKVKDESTNFKSISKTIEIKGHEILSLFHEFAMQNIERIKIVAAAELDNKKVLKSLPFKDERNYLKKKSARILENYFKDQLPDAGFNDRCQLGGKVLHHVGLFKYRTKPNWNDQKKSLERLGSNFKSALKGKIN